MKVIQAAVRLAPSARQLTTSSSRQGVSMKQSYSAAHNAGVVPSTSKYGRVQELQLEWTTKQPELLVWQKRGFRDHGITYTTYGACALAIVYGASLLWDMSWPQAAK